MSVSFNIFDTYKIIDAFYLGYINNLQNIMIGFVENLALRLLKNSQNIRRKAQRNFDIYLIKQLSH